MHVILNAIHQTVLDRGSRIVGELVGISSGVLRNKVNPHCDTHHLTVAEFVRIMAVTGDYRALQAMAHELGFVAVQLPDSGASENILGHVLSVGASHGDMCTQVHSALADQRITPGELLDCERALQQLQAHIQQLTLAVRQAAEKSIPNEYRDR